jgi:hypothetical protein
MSDAGAHEGVRVELGTIAPLDGLRGGVTVVDLVALRREAVPHAGGRSRLGAR